MAADSTHQDAAHALPILPRSIGVTIAAAGTMVCWAGVIGLVHAIG
jgi:hypothetical protein